VADPCDNVRGPPGFVGAAGAVLGHKIYQAIKKMCHDGRPISRCSSPTRAKRNSHENCPRMFYGSSLQGSRAAI
jgi:hypothetical protein